MKLMIFLFSLTLPLENASSASATSDYQKISSEISVKDATLEPVSLARDQDKEVESKSLKATTIKNEKRGFASGSGEPVELKMMPYQEEP